MHPTPAGDLAATKLRPPIPPQHLVGRTRLESVLDRADAERLPLVLVSAPAGSGKSTLVAGWAAAHDALVAWLQLEDADADPARFWTSVCAAIGRLRPGLRDHVGPVVAGSMGAGAVVVPALVNGLAAAGERLVLVLDDYHLIDDAVVHRGVERLVELCPEQLTVVMITRADPPFRLGRLRVRGRIAEIRAADLRFDSTEAAGILGEAAARLRPEGLEQLCERTEGWAAGLVLAGLSLQRTDDVDGFVESFRGDDQLVAGYLGDELLAALGADELRRMTEAAVLHRLTGPLLDEVTGSTDGAAWLADLASRNQLVIRLDHTGEWYRFHHLLRDLLLLEARRSLPGRLDELNRRAAEWFERAGYLSAAVDHLVIAGDRDAAMRLMRTVGPDLLGLGQLRRLRHLLTRLSVGGELDAICCILSGWDHYLTGEYDEAEALLTQAMARMTPDLDPMRAMPLRINLSMGKGDVARAVAGANEVLVLDDVAERPSELITAAGAAFVWAGLGVEARHLLGLALARTREEGRVTAHAMGLVALAVLEQTTGDAALARAAAQRAIEFARTSGLGEYHGIAPAYAVRAISSREEPAAVAEAEHAVTVAERATTMLGHAYVLVTAADVLLAAGAPRGEAVLEEARAAVRRCADPGVIGPILERVEARHRMGGPAPRAVGLVEQLSERELAVLRYLPSELSLPEIARELYVSPNTIKTQCAAIYRKLGVSNRHAAVLAGRERGLLRG